MLYASECWKAQVGIVGQAAKISATLLTIQPKYVFAADANSDCGSAGFSCTGNALKADLEAAYDFGVDLWFFSGRFKDSATIPLGESFGFDCSI